MKCNSCNKCSFCAKAKVLTNFGKGGLKQWFKEDWTKEVDGKQVPCGSDKGQEDGKCRPSKRVNKSTPKTWGEMTKVEKKKAKAEKTKANKKGKYKSDYRLDRKK